MCAKFAVTCSLVIMCASNECVKEWAKGRHGYCWTLINMLHFGTTTGIHIQVSIRQAENGNERAVKKKGIWTREAVNFLIKFVQLNIELSSIM